VISCGNAVGPTLTSVDTTFGPSAEPSAAIPHKPLNYKGLDNPLDSVDINMLIFRKRCFCGMEAKLHDSAGPVLRQAQDDRSLAVWRARHEWRIGPMSQSGGHSMSRLI
jgi:hypothetical protein